MQGATILLEIAKEERHWVISMYIEKQDRTVLFYSDGYDIRIKIINDEWWVYAVKGNNVHPLGKYKNLGRCKGVVHDIGNAIEKGLSIYRMPVD